MAYCAVSLFCREMPGSGSHLPLLGKGGFEEMGFALLGQGNTMPIGLCISNITHLCRHQGLEK